ncbi:ATP-binding protein [Azoarcus sp. DN11]|uniref:ATP-binding protein n=1 Tax=Azoarcus sp. DN11 TaxID=356837 RepID=UPI000EAF7109|nr:ATP-binding protein [Azoarcus sp. DN11]AYH42019.1 nitrate/nitrite two-component sensor NARX [Azoarcus sp. DN11]
MSSAAAAQGAGWRGLPERVWRMIAGRAVLLLLLLAFLVVALIGVVGIGGSVVVMESVQGSASAVNVAGSLRRLAHRAGGLAVARSIGAADQEAVQEAVAKFEAALASPVIANVLDRQPSSVFASVFRGVEAGWATRIRPRVLAIPEASPGDPSAAAHYRALLAEVDAFAEEINTLVAVLEHDAESRIEQLRTLLGAALVLLVCAIAPALYVLRRRVIAPLTGLRNCAARIAQGDFDARTRFTGRDELGRVGEAFNAMAGELSVAYRELESRVERKTADLTRSNRALELLYYVISRLYHAPASSATYAETLKDLEQTLGLRGSFICVEPKLGGAASVLASTMGECPERRAGNEDCARCSGRRAPWSYRGEGDRDVLLVPLRDAERHYGMLRLALPPGQRLADWERTLLEAVTRHMGIALGISRQSERDRLLALQEERSIIARELHDSLAQSLSFMKIQVSLLSPALARPQAREEAETILADLREGINAAYRQLRELLATFRLRIEGDFARLLGNTVSEFASRSGLPIALELELGGSHLSPNQEIHVLHIIREALSNAVRHAQATRIRVALASAAGGDITVVVEDDGRGVGDESVAAAHHFGLTIMTERARGLGGSLEVLSCPDGGTRIVLRFNPQPAEGRPELPIVMESK